MQSDTLAQGFGSLGMMTSVCIDTAEGGAMMLDLAILIRADHPWLTTNQFLDKLDSNLQRTMA